MSATKKSLKEIEYCLIENIIKIVFVSVFFLSLIIAPDFWTGLIDRFWVKPVWSKVNTEFKTILALSTFTIIVIAYYMAVGKKEKTFNRNRFVIISILFLMYLVYRISNKCIFKVCESDILIVIFIWEIIINYSKICLINKRTTSELYTGLEYCIPSNNEDKYKRTPFAQSMAKTISQTFIAEQAFATGICGEWGSGKTWFLEKLQDELQKSDQKIEIIKFAPLYCDSPNEIIKEFFAIYKKRLSTAIPQLSSRIEQYINILTDIDKSVLSKTFKFLNHTDGASDTYIKITNYLKRAKIKVLVTIDDLDRLRESEILEVMKLIRNTANFPYTHFLLAYDKYYITDCLKSVKINRPEQYLEKIINVEINLPNFESRVIYETLIAKLKKVIDECFKNLNTKELVKTNISYAEMFDDENNVYENSTIAKILPSMRGIIRFVNSFRINLEALFEASKGNPEIFLKDFFYLELLRYGFPEYYKYLAKNPLVLLKIGGTRKMDEPSKDTTSQYYVFQDNQSELTLQGNPPAKHTHNEDATFDKEPDITLDTLSSKQMDDQHDILRSILRRLFPLVRENKNHAISYIRSYFQYFSYRLDDRRIHTTEVNHIILHREDIEAKEREWFKKRKVHDNELKHSISGLLKDKSWQNRHIEEICGFVRYIFNRTNNDDRLKNEVFDGVLDFFQNNKWDNDPSEKINLFKLWKELFLLKKGENGDLNGILSKFLINRNIGNTNKNTEHCDALEKLLTDFDPPYEISLLLRIIIEKNFNYKETFLLPIEKLQQIQIHYLDKYSNKNQELDDNALILLYACTQFNNAEGQNNTANNRRKVIDLIKQKVQKKPEEYFKLFIRTDKQYNKELHFMPEPNYIFLFGGNDGFDQFIKDKPLDKIKSIGTIRLFWEKFKANEYKPIMLENNTDENIKSFATPYNEKLFLITINNRLFTQHS